MNILPGNDIRVKWDFTDKNNVEIDFSTASFIEVAIKHARAPIAYIPSSVNITNGNMYFEIPAEELRMPGIYHAIMKSTWPSDGHADGDQKVTIMYPGAISISCTGRSCSDISIKSVLCLDSDSDFQNVNVLKAYWGAILGDIRNQQDLVQLIASMSCDCEVVWGKILGNIEDQKDLTDYIIKLIKEYSGGGGDTTYNVTASVNDASMGSITPASKTIKKGEGSTFAVSANAGYRVKSYTVPAGVTTTGVGAGSGAIVVSNVQSNMTIACTFEAIPAGEFMISPDHAELNTNGDVVSGFSLSSVNGWAIQGGVVTGNSAKVLWSTDSADHITIDWTVANNVYAFTVKSTTNKADARTKTITFKENTTNKATTLNVSQSGIVVQQFTLTTSTSGNGAITSITPSSVDGNYAAGTNIELVANNGSSTNDVFDYWMVGAAKYTTRTINVLMDANKTATAYFKNVGPSPVYFDVVTEVNVEGRGTVEGSGTYLAGATATVKANPAPGYVFSSWTGDISSFANPYQFTVDGAKTVRANFSAEQQSQYVLAITKSPTNGGNVSGAGTYNANTNVAIEATPASGYKFVNWSGDVVQGWQNQNPLTIGMTSNKNIVANFELIPVNKVSYALNITEGGGNGGDADTWPQDQVVMASARIQESSSRQVFGGMYYKGDYPVSGEFTKNTSDTYLGYELVVPYYRFGDGVANPYVLEPPHISNFSVPGSTSTDNGEEVTIKVNVPIANGNANLSFMVYWHNPYGRVD